MCVRNPVEGIRCRIKSLGMFKGTIPLLRHLLSRISSLGLFKGTVPLLRLYWWIPSFCDRTVPNPWCLSLPTAISCPPPVRGRLLLVVAMIGWVILIVFVLLASCWFECWHRVEGVVSSTHAHTLQKKKKFTSRLSRSPRLGGWLHFGTMALTY
jgi:hypothetical protein